MIIVITEKAVCLQISLLRVGLQRLLLSLGKFYIEDTLFVFLALFHD